MSTFDTMVKIHMMMNKYDEIYVKEERELGIKYVLNHGVSMSSDHVSHPSFDAPVGLITCHVMLTIICLCFFTNKM